MRTLRRALQGGVGIVGIAAPLFASAQWNVGRMNAAASQLPGGSIWNIIMMTLAWLLGILGFIAIMGFVISGIQYLLAAGNEQMAETAKNNMKYSLIGVVVGLMGYVIVRAVETWLSASIIPF
jgi:heme/copper-type cytochrome/quinol oxidase subunit 2